MHRPILLALLFLGLEASAAEPTWTTYRGNAQRTANTDGVAGPTSPRVLWVHRAQEHFIAAPVPAGDKLIVSGIGAFNVPSFLALNTDPKAAERVAWNTGVPYLKLPTVSSPAVLDGKLLFGDGMHQTNGAVLHCMRLDKGMPLWQLPVPGELVHLEGSPAVADGKVYLGGGAAGVLCADLERATLDGKEMPLTEIQKVLDKQWTVLQAKYEEEKKKDPDFAIPPSFDSLPKPAPVKLWEQGKEKWHVDAPVAVTNGKVLVASAFLDKEQVGERALFCLDGKTGAIQWQTRLKFNPWGGPTVVGNVVVVSGSSIGYDPKALKGAKGEVAAFSLDDGKEKWRTDVPGGVLSCVAAVDKTVIATATDGKVRALDLESGERKWAQVYDAKAPIFAAPAVVAGVVYVADLKGVVHAVGLEDGKGKWTLDLANHPDVKAPGMVYGGPVVHGGRVFVATCNLEGATARQGTVVVCIGDK